LKLSFEEARLTLGLLVRPTPSTEVFEQTVLGLGKHTAADFERAPAPADDGDVMVIQVESKEGPTATGSETLATLGPEQEAAEASPASPEKRPSWAVREERPPNAG
jgi:hypothetical protein